MKKLATQSARLIAVAGIIACGSTANRPRPTPGDIVVEPRAETISHAAPPGGWSFRLAAEPSTYRVTRIAAIEAPSDSGLRREVSTNTTYEVVSLQSNQSSDTMVVTAVADSFATTTQGRIGSVQPVQLPAKIGAIITGSGIAVEGQPQAEKCDPVVSALVSDLRNLLPAFPTRMTPGMSWSDSIQAAGCQAGIPTVFELRRAFIVSGETTGQGQPLLVILRTDTISARGEGSQLQHRIALQTEGNGRATYYLESTTGKIVRLTTGQNLSLSFSASARTTRFRESSQQEFLLVR